jgi:hypothetical protein
MSPGRSTSKSRHFAAFLITAFLAMGGSMACLGQVITTVAGGGYMYTSNGIPATQAAIRSPQGVATDSAGNLYYFDTGGFVVRQANSSGIVNTVAGNGMLA